MKTPTLEGSYALNGIARESNVNWAFLRCPICMESLAFAPKEDSEPEKLRCTSCGASFPITAGIPRMLTDDMRDSLNQTRTKTDIKAATALSFGYEWSHFSEMRPEWERNFLDYVTPREPEFFERKRVLDAGCGTGRHAYYAAKFGAEVWAIDLGPAVDVAYRNTRKQHVKVIQADLYHPPFEPESFDFVYSIGVLHHLPQPEAAFRNLLRFLRPGGEVLIYLYWKPEGQSVKQIFLWIVRLARRITTKLPHPLLHALSYPAAVLVHLGFVLPYRLMKRMPALSGVSHRIPMKQYADYPFNVCVNDQFDRFSAPIENRYTKAEVTGWLERAGLEDIQVQPNYGWCGTGRKPA